MQKKHHFYDVCTGVSINNLDDDEKLQEVSSSSELMDTFYIRNNFFSVFHYSKTSKSKSIFTYVVASLFFTSLRYNKIIYFIIHLIKNKNAVTLMCSFVEHLKPK